MRQNKMVSTTLVGFSGQFFNIFEIKLFCFVVTICDLVHGVGTMYGLC